MAQQTAVEWLESELDFLYQYMAERDRSKLFEQAKAIEKEQIMMAWIDGRRDGYQQIDIEHGKEYYNETYKK